MTDTLTIVIIALAVLFILFFLSKYNVGCTVPTANSKYSQGGSNPCQSDNGTSICGTDTTCLNNFNNTNVCSYCATAARGAPGNFDANFYNCLMSR